MGVKMDERRGSRLNERRGSWLDGLRERLSLDNTNGMDDDVKLGLKEQVESLRIGKSELQNQLKQQTEEFALELENLDNKKRSLEKEIVNLQNELLKKNDENQQLGCKLEVIGQTFENLEKSSSAIRDNNLQLKQEIIEKGREHQVKIEDLEAVVVQLQSQVEYYKKGGTEDCIHISNDSKKEDLGKETSSQAEQLSLALMKIEQNEIKTGEYQRVMANYQEKVKKLEEERNDANSKLEHCLSDLSSVEAQRRELETSLSRVACDKNEISLKMESLEKDLTREKDLKSEFEMTVKQKQNELEAFERNIAELRLKLTNDIAHVSENVKEEKDKAEKITEELTKENEDLRKTKENVSVENVKLLNEVAELKDENATLLQERTCMEASVLAAKDKAEAKDLEIVKLKDDIVSVRSRYDKLAESLEMKKSAADENNVNITILNYEKEELLRKLSKSEIEISRLKSFMNSSSTRPYASRSDDSNSLRVHENSLLASVSERTEESSFEACNASSEELEDFLVHVRKLLGENEIESTQDIFTVLEYHKEVLLERNELADAMARLEETNERLTDELAELRLQVDSQPEKDELQRGDSNRKKNELQFQFEKPRLTKRVSSLGRGTMPIDYIAIVKELELARDMEKKEAHRLEMELRCLRKETESAKVDRRKSSAQFNDINIKLATLENQVDELEESNTELRKEVDMKEQMIKSHLKEKDIWESLTDLNSPGEIVDKLSSMNEEVSNLKKENKVLKKRAFEAEELASVLGKSVSKSVRRSSHDKETIILDSQGFEKEDIDEEVDFAGAIDDIEYQEQLIKVSQAIKELTAKRQRKKAAPGTHSLFSDTFDSKAVLCGTLALLGLLQDILPANVSLVCIILAIVFENDIAQHYRLMLIILYLMLRGCLFPFFAISFSSTCFRSFGNRLQFR